MDVQQEQPPARMDDLDFAERKLVMDERVIMLAGKAAEVLNLVNGYSNLDSSTKAQFETLIKNTIFKPPSPLSCLHTVVGPKSGLNLNTKAEDMGYIISDKESYDIGKIMDAKYQAKYNTVAIRHKMFVKGSYVWIDTYTDRDIKMLEDAILEVMAKRQPISQQPSADNGIPHEEEDAACDCESDAESNCDKF
jgi:hypothetical protein